MPSLERIYYSGIMCIQHLFLLGEPNVLQKI
jgi:hypothetical protein